MLCAYIILCHIIFCDIYPPEDPRGRHAGGPRAGQREPALPLRRSGARPRDQYCV